MKRVLLLPTLSYWGHWSTTDRVSDLPEVTQLTRVRVRFGTRLSGPRVHTFNPTTIQLQHYTTSYSRSLSFSPLFSVPIPLPGDVSSSPDFSWVFPKAPPWSSHLQSQALYSNRIDHNACHMCNSEFPMGYIKKVKQKMDKQGPTV